MANAELLAELVRAHYAGDQRRFGNLLNQVIASESRAGHSRLAQRLRDLRAEGEVVRSQESPRATPLARAPKDLEQYLSVSYTQLRLNDLVLDDQSSSILRSYITEQRAAEKLANHGLKPRRRLLLHGPPGCGKTATAHALAGELRLPIVRVRLELVFSRYLGDTAATLTDIFAEASRLRGVYLFDEFDALGRTRLDDNDIGEIKRIVATFLQLLDADNSDSIFVAATNTGRALDNALFRRFDDVVELVSPDRSQATELLRRLLRRWKQSPSQGAVDAATGLSYADIRAAVDDAQKASVLDGRDYPDPDGVLAALRRRAERLR